MDVVCTAGHVDHGKSTLVEALTGMQPDRLAEEQRRGLTIDIGFGWAEISAGGRTRTVAFVDLPGHDRFIPNMLAGAGPVESALFVVAADEGWKPQSQEHLEILDLLGVSAGVIAVTKADAVDAAQVATTAAEIRRHVAGTSLAATPVVTVSAKTGEGLDSLRAALVDVLDARSALPSEGRPRLWVDRAFSVKGSGTVVTGTLTGGPIRTNDEVVVLPGGSQARVRGLQSLKQSVATAQPGDRVAMNLSGLDRHDVRRGQMLTSPDAAAPTTTMDVWLRVLPDRRVGRRGAWHLHAGSGEWSAVIRPLGEAALTKEGFARVALTEPAPLLPGDRFVLRDSGRRATVGGGVVLDVEPLPLRGRDARVQRAEQLQRRLDAVRTQRPEDLLQLHVEERGAAPAIAAAAAVGLVPERAAAAASEAGLLRLGAAWAAPAAASRWASAAIEALARHHADHPLERSAPKDVVVRAASDAGCPRPFAGDLVAVLVRLGRVVGEGTGLRHPDHGVTLSPEDQRARDALLAALTQTPYSPPRLSEAAAGAGASTTLVRELEAEGVVVRVGPDLAVTRQALDLAAELLRRSYPAPAGFTASQAKETLQTTRKFALPLLEELDRRGVTHRNGDIRHIR